MKFKNKFVFCLLLFLFGCVLKINLVNAYECPEKIRVGLESKYKALDNIKIKNKKIYIGVDENLDTCLESKNNFEVIAGEKKYYIATQKKYLNYQDALEAKKLCEKYLSDYKIFVCFDGEWQICCGEFDDLDQVQLANKKINGKIIDNNSEFIKLRDDNSTSDFIESCNNNTRVLFINKCLQVKSDDCVCLTGDDKYRGIIEIGFFGGKKLMAVNEIDLEEYLYGVVPCEMPSYWHEDALKAQAVAARTYAVTKKMFNEKYFCDICDTAHCQVYKGFNFETERTNKAVDETKNICILHEEKLISALYFSSSGGCTEDAVNLWSKSVPYLKSVIEINETARIWEREFSFAEIKKILEDKKINIGNIIWVEISELAQTGRVNEILITGTKGEAKFEKENINSLFANTKGGSLASRMFRIYIECDKSKNDFVVKFQGRGCGHAVGMSQYGAKGMAELGFKFDDILKYYYTNVELK